MIKIKFRIPSFDIPKLEKVLVERGEKFLREAGAAYVNAGVVKVAIDTGMAASAFTPLSRVLAKNIVTANISARIKSRGKPGRSRGLGESQSGFTFDSVGFIFTFSIFSDIQHLIFLESNKAGAAGSPFNSRKAAKEAFINYFKLNFLDIFPRESDKIVKYTHRSTG